MFGQPIQEIEKIPTMTQFAWRPRPNNILTRKEEEKLKTEFRKKYGKMFKEEQLKDNASVNQQVSDSKKLVRDKFLNEFFLPMR